MQRQYFVFVEALSTKKNPLDNEKMHSVYVEKC